MDNLNSVSIIIPCFNDGLYINDTVKSVLQSTFTDFEIIIVDDNSTDLATLDALSKLAQLPNIQVVTNPIKGVCSARNYGVSLAKNTYILFLDADDLIDRTFLEKTTRILNEYDDVKVVTTRIRMFGIKNNELQLPDFNMSKLLANNLFVVTSLFRRKDFIPFNENMLGGYEDWDFWISLLKSGGRVFRINEVLFYYRIKKRKLSRNLNIAPVMISKIRANLWSNHKELYSLYYIDIKDTMEYQQLLQSYEYRLGLLILYPIRIILNKIRNKNNNDN